MKLEDYCDKCRKAREEAYRQALVMPHGFVTEALICRECFKKMYPTMGDDKFEHPADKQYYWG
jgi:hypothetical protein